MSTLSKEQLLKIKESLKAGSLSDKWWRKLKKDIKSCKLSDEDKIITFCCIIRGLGEECYHLAKNGDDITYVHDVLHEVFSHE